MRGTEKGAPRFQPALGHCPACGGEGAEWPTAKEMNCRACGFVWFLNVAAATALVLEAEGKILLAVRGGEPARGWLDLPGGFLEPGEDAEQGLRREVREELGLELPALRLLGTHANTYPWGGVTYHTLDLIYHAALAAVPPVTAGDDVSSVEWHPLAGFDPGRLAFASGRVLLARLQRERALQAGPGGV